MSGVQNQKHKISYFNKKLREINYFTIRQILVNFIREKKHFQIIFLPQIIFFRRFDVGQHGSQNRFQERYHMSGIARCQITKCSNYVIMGR